MRSEKANERLNGKKVIYNYGCVSYCPPDCGTPDDDTYEDVPHCPACDLKLESLPMDNYCRNCGQKLVWG
jgi:predicted amidophosphoribosyltransferase